MINIDNNEFYDLKFLIYSSHKTSTQSLNCILNTHKYKTRHCHHLSDLTLCMNNPPVYDNFKQYLINYKNINKKKLKIISCIRNPKDRLISSFFQSYSSNYGKIEGSDETFISVKTEEELCCFYKSLIENKKLPARIESLDELSHILDINILNEVERKKDYYYLNNYVT